MGVIVPQTSSEDRAAGGHRIDGSLSFRGVQDNSATDGSDLRRTPSTVGNRKTGTLSCWFKRSSLGFDQQVFYAGSDANNTAHIRFDSDDTLTCFDYTVTFTLNPSNRFRDYDWHHLVVAIDTTQGTASNRVKMYYDGVLQTAFDTETYPAQNLELLFNSTSEHSIGRNNVNGNNYFCGSLTDFYWIDGQQLAASDFGYTDELTNTWRPKKYVTPSSYTDLNGGKNWTGTAVSGVSGWTQALANGFNGSLSNAAEGNTNGETATIALGQTVTVAAGGVGVYTWVTSGNPLTFKLILDGVVKETINQGASGGQWYWSSSYAGDIDAISVARDGKAPEWGAIEVNGQRLTDNYTDPEGWGINGFHLPFDGSGRLGEDQSGKGNDWAGHNVYGKVGFDKGTEGYPILETINGGTTAGPVVRGSVGVAVSVYNSKYYLDGEEAKTVKFVPGQTVTFDTSDTTVGGHPFRISGTANGSHNSFYSVDFDGTGDYLSLSPGADYAFGTGDFTVEGWFYYDAQSQYDYLLDSRNSGQTTGTWTLSHDYTGTTSPSGLLQWCTDSSAILTAPVNPPTSQWVHIAVSRSGTTTRLFYDGIMQKSVTDSTNYSTSPTTSYIGARYSNQHNFEGKISDLRVVKGTAVYTSNFQPPAVPLTNITNTKLLCCNQSTTTGSTVEPGTITANGDPTSSDTNPYDEYVYGTATGAISEGTVGAATTITIPHNAPSDLYYYCTNHSGMGGSVSIGATDHSVADPYAWKCVYAVPLIINTDYSDRVNCTTARKSISVSGGTTPKLRESHLYGASYDFDGSNDYFSTPYEAAFNFGAEPFTVECWAKSTQSGAYGTLVGRWTSPNSTACWDLRMATADYGNRVAFMTRDDDEAFRVLDSGVKANDGEWHHLAVSRTLDDISIFVDGEKKNTLTYTYSNGKINTDTTTSLRIGLGDGSNYFDGRVNDVRIYKGIGKYTNSFAVPSVQPDILPDTPSGVAYQSLLSKPIKHNGGSFYTDGVEDYLKADLALGSGDFTLEYWAKHWNLYNYETHVSTTRGATGFNVGTDAAGGFVWYDQAPSTGGANRKIEVLGVVGLNQWQHFAYVRSGSTISGYLDGKLMATYTSSVDYSQTAMTIGGLDYAASHSEWCQAWFSNVRVTIGQAIYTKPFTPSTEPLTATSQGAIASNVKLLCAQDDHVIGAKVSPSVNTSTINDGRVWYPYLTSNSIFKDNAFAFDGDLTTRAQTKNAGSGKTLTFAPVPPVNFTTTLEVYTDQGATGPAPMPTASWDGNSVEPGQGAWVTVYSGSGTLGPDKPLVINTNSAGQYATLKGVRIDGVILRDPVSYHCDEAGDNAQTQGRVSTDSPFNTIDSVRGQETQYATLSPVNTMNTNAKFYDGNLRAQITGPCTVASSIPMFKGKWYCEIINTAHASTHTGIGIAKIDSCDGNRQPDEGQHRGGWGLWHISGDGSYHKIGHGGSWGSQSTTWEDWGDTWGTNGDYDVMGLALDMDNRKINFFKNGEDMGSNENGLDKQIDWGTLIDAMANNGTIQPNTSWANNDIGMVFVIGNGQTGATSDFICNFGQQPWKFTPPPGYEAATPAACYDRPTFVRPDKQYFKPYKWTGESTGSGSGSNVDHHHELGFVPDLMFIKNTDNVEQWYAFDSVRGWDYEAGLNPNNTDAASAVGGRNTYPVAEDNGFTLKAQNPSGGGSTGGEIDFYGRSYISYNWKAGGSKGTWNLNGDDVGSLTAAGLNYGDTSVLTGASINTKAGFSIVTYTQDSGGASKNIAHGLTRAPQFVMMKHVNSTSNWFVMHTAIENLGKILYFNLSVDQDTSSDFGGAWPGATYTATSTTGVNGRQVILYSWHDVKGVQKFGQYEGNGDASKGVYCHLGFKPAVVWVKQLDGNTNWWGWDSARKSINPNSIGIALNDAVTQVDGNNYYIDFLHDGFKMYNTYSEANNSGSKYCYCAWAEQPTFNLYGTQ